MNDIDGDALERMCRATFRDHEGLLLRDGAWTPETLVAWKKDLMGDATAIEGVVNHIHLRQVFFDAEDYLTDEIIYAARKIQSSWAQTLSRAFPVDSFEVEFIQPTEGESDICDFQLTVRRKRNAV
jgi:hypothetical protein